MAKGGTYENEICKELSLWWTEGERDDVFRRTQSSGGRFTSRKKSNKDTAFQAGDITFSDPIGKQLIDNWNIECKTGYKLSKDKNGKMLRWDVLDFFDSKQKEPILLKMWNQCKRDAEITMRIPILIFRRNQRLSCIMIDHSYAWHLAEYFTDIGDGIYLEFNRKRLNIYSLKHFFTRIDNIKISLNHK